MSADPQSLSGPDLAAGIPESELREGKPLRGHAFGEPVLLARAGGQVYAVAANCTHYGGPLEQGLQLGTSVRCPWHHAAFELGTGAASAPALEPLACYALARDEAGTLRVTGRRSPPAPQPHAGPTSVVIVGGGAAGHCAADMLRRQGYRGPVTILSADASAPYDRPNLSKDYLAGTAPEEWLPLRPASHYAERDISLRLSTRVTGIDAARRAVTLEDGTRLPYGALLLATGAEPVALDVPGAQQPHVRTLRTLADCRGLIDVAKSARRALVVGASFIGLEAASALRARGLEVDVVGHGEVPLEKVLGREVGTFLRRLHEEHGVRFHLPGSVRSIPATDRVLLEDGQELAADLVVVGIGVRPALQLAEAAGLALDRGVKTDAYLQTSAPGIWAAGDIARWEDPRTGQALRVEHWAVAQRQGETAALNILGQRRPFTDVPFFWTVQHEVPLAYVGHAQRWDAVEVDGSLEARDCTVRYLVGGRTVAALTVNRGAQSLEIEAELEREALRAAAQPESARAPATAAR